MLCSMYKMWRQRARMQVCRSEVGARRGHASEPNFAPSRAVQRPLLISQTAAQLEQQSPHSSCAFFYSTIDAVMTPLPKNSLIVPNLSLLRCNAS